MSVRGPPEGGATMQVQHIQDFFVRAGSIKPDVLDRDYQLSLSTPAFCVRFCPVRRKSDILFIAFILNQSRDAFFVHREQVVMTDRCLRSSALNSLMSVIFIANVTTLLCRQTLK